MCKNGWNTCNTVMFGVVTIYLLVPMLGIMYVRVKLITTQLIIKTTFLFYWLIFHDINRLIDKFYIHLQKQTVTLFTEFELMYWNTVSKVFQISGLCTCTLYSEVPTVNKRWFTVVTTRIRFNSITVVCCLPIQ